MQTISNSRSVDNGSNDCDILFIALKAVNRVPSFEAMHGDANAFHKINTICFETRPIQEVKAQKPLS